MNANNIVLAGGANIGQNGAEHDDEFLFKCFVDHPAYSQITDVNNPATFLVGSTGAGKTAILRMVGKLEDNALELAVHDMAMNHIAYNDTILFLKSLDVDLTLFFQALWKHVFAIEYIKVALHARDKGQFKFKLSNLLSSITRQKAREKLESFADKNEDRFWNTVDENVIELAENLQKEFNVDFGGEVKKFLAKAGYVHSLGSQQKIQLQQRATQFLNKATLSELPEVINALSEYTRDRQDKYYITVDGLDEHWVDETIKFQLLQAMFESLKSLKKLRNFQVIVALRNDLYVRMVRETPSSRRQVEKFEDLIVRIKWSKPQLRELADKRVRELFRRQYTSDVVSFSDIFKQYPDGKTSPWDYLLRRTLMRPRDIINFINSTLAAAEGKSAVSKNNFLSGEASYSNLRLETLIHEWSGTFPGMKALLELLRNRPAYRDAGSLITDGLIDMLYSELGKTADLQRDEIYQRIESYTAGKSSLEPLEMGQIVLFRLHLVGSIGLKLQPDRPWDWIFESYKPVVEGQIGPGTKFKVHPMLFYALSIRT